MRREVHKPAPINKGPINTCLHQRPCHHADAVLALRPLLVSLTKGRSGSCRTRARSHKLVSGEIKPLPHESRRNFYHQIRPFETRRADTAPPPVLPSLCPSVPLSSSSEMSEGDPEVSSNLGALTADGHRGDVGRGGHDKPTPCIRQKAGPVVVEWSVLFD